MSENLSQKAYWHIHDQLTSGALRPGLRLSNRALAKEVGVSFTPVREALNRLVSEGLLEYREGLGVFVPETTRRELEEIYDVREMLECAVVARFCGRLPEQTLREMREICDEMGRIVQSARREKKMGQRGERFRELDSAFHLAMIRGTGNRHLLDAIAHLRKKCAIKSGRATVAEGLVGHVFHAEPFESVERTQREHHELLALLEKGDAEKASALMCQHIRAGRELSLAAFDQVYINATASRRAPRPGAPS